MAISYPLSLPDTDSFSDARMTAKTVVGVTRSPFTGAQQVQKHQGQWWEFECSLIRMKRQDAEKWIAFLLALNGMEGSFLLGDPLGSDLMGSGGGTPIIAGSNQTGQTLVTSGWATSTNILKSGDYIQIGSSLTTRLHKVLSDVTSSNTGDASLDLFPEVKTPPTNGTSIVTSNAKGVFRLSANDMPFELKQASTYGLSFAARSIV